jgi:hypothetical protein
MPLFIVVSEDFVKRDLGRIIAAIFSFSVMSACTPAPNSNTAPKNPKVIAPMNNQQGQYKFGSIVLEGISDIQTLAGKYVQFKFSPRIENGKLEGGSPKTRFVKNTKGEYAPADELTQQMVSIYAHLQNLAKLDDELGATGVNTWPRDVGVGVRVSGGLKNNAFYDGNSDAMLSVPYDKSGLAIAINGGILAHEHFHSLFYKLAVRENFLKTSIHDEQSLIQIEKDLQLTPGNHADEISAESLRNLYNIVLVRGLNEGLADYWGWMYSGDTDFISQSLPKEGAGRSLKVTNHNQENTLPNQQIIEHALSVLYSTGNQESMREYTVGYAYTVGTKISRVLKKMAEIYGHERQVDEQQSRKEIAKIIIKTLPVIKDEFSKKTGAVAFTSVDYLKSFVQFMGPLKQGECDYLVEIFNNSEKIANKSYSCIEENSNWKINLQDQNSLQKNTTAVDASSGQVPHPAAVNWE